MEDVNYTCIASHFILLSQKQAPFNERKKERKKGKVDLPNASLLVFIFTREKSVSDVYVGKHNRCRCWINKLTLCAPVSLCLSQELVNGVFAFMIVKRRFPVQGYHFVFNFIHTGKMFRFKGIVTSQDYNWSMK